MNMSKTAPVTWLTRKSAAAITLFPPYTEIRPGTSFEVRVAFKLRNGTSLIELELHDGSPLAIGEKESIIYEAFNPSKA